MSGRKAPDLAAMASLFLGVLLPVLMALANKSAPLILAFAAALSMGAVIHSGQWQLIYNACKARLQSRSSVIAIATLLWMGVSISWSHDLRASFMQFWEFSLPLSFGLGLAACFPHIAPKNRSALWAAGIALASLFVILELVSGLKFQILFGKRAFDFTYNRTLVTLMILIWPVLALVFLRGHKLYGLIAVPLIVAVFLGASGAATLGVLISMIVFVMAWRWPEGVRKTGLALVLIGLSIAPFIGTFSNQFLGRDFHETFKGSHSDERIKLWISYEAAVHKKPLHGHGYGASRNLQSSPTLKDLPESLLSPLADNHPHNGFLQIWVEIGLIGALFFALLAHQLFQWAGSLHRSIQPYALTWIAVVASVAAVSHGLWQPWWIAVIAASAVGFITLNRELADDAKQAPQD